MKLNIGCGKKFEPDYYNIDLYEELIADKIMSALNLEFDDNYSEEIKAIHVIEHLSFFETKYALSEFFRVLKPNGKLILEIPDIEKACQYFINSDDEYKKDVLGWIFGIPHKGLQHKFCFPSFLLIELLENLGYINIKTNSFTNYESIPTLRFECFKPQKIEDFEVYQILANIRKVMLLENYIDFSNSFLTKEQEDLLTFILIKFLDFKKKKKIEIILEIIIESLMRWPYIVKIFLSIIKDENIISQTQIKHFSGITDLLIKLNFSNILCHSLKKAPMNPGTQKIAFSSIESFARGVIKKLLLNINEKEKVINKLEELFNEIEYPEINFFSSNIIQRKSLDYFYIGIKAFYEGNYKTAHNKFLRAIKLYRDDFLYFWNFAKILANLDMKEKSRKFYKKALIVLRVTNIQLKPEIKKEIKREINWLNSNKDSIPEFKPIESLEKFQKKTYQKQ